MLDLVLIGLAITLEPIPLSAFVLILPSERGVRKGLAFVAVWLICLVAVVAVVGALTGGKPVRPHTAPSTASSAVRLAVGVILMALGGYRMKHRPASPKKPPRWLHRLRTLSLWSAAGLAALLQPWGLIAAGAATVTEADLSQASTYVALALFCVLATASLLVLESYAAIRSESAKQRLGQLYAWLQDHMRQVGTAVALALGLWLTVKGAYQLAR